MFLIFSNILIWTGMAKGWSGEGGVSTIFFFFTFFFSRSYLIIQAIHFFRKIRETPPLIIDHLIRDPTVKFGENETFTKNVPTKSILVYNKKHWYHNVRKSIGHIKKY
jgi:hypothetical protein